MFLAGAFNPYVREAPYPPTHINFNYLIDPRQVATSLTYRPLYDEHKDDVVDNRADPLIFPNARDDLRFDPNDHPVPVDKDVPWQELVYDFFTK